MQEEPEISLIDIDEPVVVSEDMEIPLIDKVFWGSGRAGEKPHGASILLLVLDKLENKQDP